MKSPLIHIGCKDQRERGQAPSLLPPSWSQKGAEHCVPLQGADLHTPPTITGIRHSPPCCDNMEPMGQIACTQVKHTNACTLTQNMVGELANVHVFRLHVTCVWWSASGKQQGQEKEKHLCKTARLMWKRSGLNVHFMPQYIFPNPMFLQHRAWKCCCWQYLLSLSPQCCYWLYLLSLLPQVIMQQTTFMNLNFNIKVLYRKMCEVKLGKTKKSEKKKNYLRGKKILNYWPVQFNIYLKLHTSQSS